jgi:hypothetical protein
VVKIDAEAVGAMLDDLIAPRSAYEELEPDYEWNRCLAAHARAHATSGRLRGTWPDAKRGDALAVVLDSERV